MNFEKFLESEENDAGKLYSDIVFALEEIEDYVPKEQLNNRTYVKYLPVLKEYMDMIKNAKIEDHSKGTFQKIFSSNSDMESKLQNFKNENFDKFMKLRDCVKCKCLNCPSECIMEGCNRCDKSGFIATCDKKLKTVYIFNNKHLELTNDKTGSTDLYKVLTIIFDKEYNQFYIIIEGNGEKFVLYYYPGISEDTYGEITDTDDFNFAIEAYESVEL